MVVPFVNTRPVAKLAVIVPSPAVGLTTTRQATRVPTARREAGKGDAPAHGDRQVSLRGIVPFVVPACAIADPARPVGTPAIGGSRTSQPARVVSPQRETGERPASKHGDW